MDPPQGRRRRAEARIERRIYAEQALADLEGILDYIAQDNPPAAMAFAESLIASCEALAKNPKMGERREDIPKDI